MPTPYVPWFLQEDGEKLLQEDGNLLLIDGEIDYIPDPPPGGGGGGGGVVGTIIWDSPADRKYETGIDRGVLYLPNGGAVPWNGLIDVTEKHDGSVEAIHYDGMKTNDDVSPGDFSASLKAFTYPNEFAELEGMGIANPGMLLGNQHPKPFNLCYRTLIGSQIAGDALGYKLHILYNLTAMPTDTTYETLSDSPSYVEFEWDLTAVPEEVPGFRPTSHVVIDSTEFDPAVLVLLEEMLYGTPTVPPHLLPLGELINYLNDFFRVRIIDNGDGTWTAITSQVGVITFPATGEFAIANITGTYLDANTYQISTTQA